jgi:uncharacterized MAPEG superfamily protein
MTTDLWMLLAAAGLYWLLIMTPATAKILANGLPWAAGNRDEARPNAAWVDRADRCVANFTENLPIFAILVLVAHVSETADAISAAGAMTFVVGRVAHAASYLAGIPWLRTGLWGVSIVGMGMIAWAIVA